MANDFLKLSLSSTRSPIFWFDFLIRLAFTAASSFERLRRRVFCAPTRNFSRHSSSYATVRPCVHTALSTEVSPLKILPTSATRCLAVHHSIGSDASTAILPPTWCAQDHGVELVSISRGAG